MMEHNISENHGRTDLITRFYCTECGKKLNISYDKVDHKYVWERSDPTGAQCRYNCVAVFPCQYCIDKHTGPAKALAKAVKELTGNCGE